MPKFIKSSAGREDAPVFINVDNIIYVAETTDAKARVFFNTSGAEHTKQLNLNTSYVEFVALIESV